MAIPIEVIDEAAKLKARLTEFRQALNRLQGQIFKSAELVILDVAHGHMGQQSQSKIALDRDQLVPFVEEQIAGLMAELRRLGFEP